MITLLAYWYVLLWNVPTKTFMVKSFFCTFSTFEIVGEIIFLIVWVVSFLMEKVNDKAN